MKNLFSNKVKAMYNNLLKSGYYFQPQKFENCTIVLLCKDLNPENCTSRKTVFCEVNLFTAKLLSDIFGFKIRKEKLYFGKAEPIENYLKRQ